MCDYTNILNEISSGSSWEYLSYTCDFKIAPIETTDNYHKIINIKIRNARWYNYIKISE